MNLDFLNKFDNKKYIGIYIDADSLKYFIESISARNKVITLVLLNQKDKNYPFKLNFYENEVRVVENQILMANYYSSAIFYKIEKTDLSIGFDNFCKCCNNTLRDNVVVCSNCSDSIHESCCDMTYDFCKICMQSAIEK